MKEENMITLIFVLLSLLDFQRIAIAADGIEKQFVVSRLVEASLTECATNPQGGAGSQLELLPRWDKSLPSDAGVNEWNNMERMLSDEGYRDGTAISPTWVRPIDPPTPPKAETPEPATVAILSITAATLLFLLYGQRLRRRLLRRI